MVRRHFMKVSYLDNMLQNSTFENEKGTSFSIQKKVYFRWHKSFSVYSAILYQLSELINNANGNRFPKYPLAQFAIRNPTSYRWDICPLSSSLIVLTAIRKQLGIVLRLSIDPYFSRYAISGQCQIEVKNKENFRFGIFEPVQSES